MLNPFFLQGSKTEQSLVQDLINEQLRMYGIEVYYLPRQYITERTVIREVIESAFSSSYPIEAYVETYDGYSENPTILSKFGIQALNEITLTISKERFKTYISPLIQNQPDIKLSSRPKEGDIIYFPLGKRLFEIKYVEHEKPFYQLQGTYTYQLRCELFRYEDEVIDTSIGEIDELISGNVNDPEKVPVGNLVNLRMVGVGVTASAVTSIVNGGVRYVTVTNRGGGYTSTPNVGISSAPSSGKTATAIAKMIGGIVVCNDNINPQAKSVQSVQIANPGYGYTTTPGVRFIGGGGSGAAAIATIGDGIVGVITVTNPGSGYAIAPSIVFSGISTVSAAATAISIGNFIFNEVITGSQSGTAARVKSWDSTTNLLQASNVDGEFILGENIIGSESGASHYLRSIEIYPTDDGYASNEEIQIEANNILDFSESNPFGMP